MVSVTAFLTITNIALGYGLAIYIHRHYGTLLFSRKKSIQTESSMIGTEEVSQTYDELSTVVEPTPVFEPGPVMAEASDGIVEADPAGTVDDENVLAGIEEFRSQLAKMSEPQAAAIEEPEGELVGSAG